MFTSSECFSIYFDCLDSQTVGTEVESKAEGNALMGESCDVGRDRDKSHGGSSHVVGSD